MSGMPESTSGTGAVPVTVVPHVSVLTGRGLDLVPFASVLSKTFLIIHYNALCDLQPHDITNKPQVSKAIVHHG